MKYLILFISLTVSCLSHSQRTVVFFDTLTSLPIKNVHVYYSNQLLTLSNDKGEVQISKDQYPVRVKSWGHQESTFENYRDTVILAPKFQQIKEVTIKPIDYNKFYKELVKSSQTQVLSDTTTIIRGDFFHSLMFIDLKNHDSTYILKRCDLTLKQNRTSKKIDYDFYPTNGEKYIRFEGAKKSKDTSKISSMNAFIPKFSKMLQYDLSKTKKYKIDFENNQAVRELGEINSLFIKKKSDKYITEVQVDYAEDCISQFQKEIKGNCNKPTNILNISMCIKNQSQLIEFEKNDNHQLKNIVFHITIDFTIDDEPYTIKVAQGFIQNNFTESTIANQFKDVATYFESLDFSEDTSGLDFYQF